MAGLGPGFVCVYLQKIIEKEQWPTLNCTDIITMAPKCQMNNDAELYSIFHFRFSQKVYNAFHVGWSFFIILFSSTFIRLFIYPSTLPFHSTCTTQHTYSSVKWLPTTTTTKQRYTNLHPRNAIHFRFMAFIHSHVVSLKTKRFESRI